MPQVASVRLRYASQDYWFDPKDLELQIGDHVVVETSKGKEIGLCTQEVGEVDESEVTKPLKPIVRIATEKDLEKADELSEKAQEALKIFREMVAEQDIPMNPTAVEFSFDGGFATFYFTSEERVDFRGLVRDLASEFHVRVDMRQIGSRDEARMLGGLGHCGEELCCARLGCEFQPVSIRMAKEQDLPLNPTKISGLCGRLICCLRYEFEAYKDFKSRAPKKNGVVDTPAGIGKVVEFDTPRETVRLRMEDGSSLTLPVELLDTGGKVAREGERIRPCHISQANFDKVMEELNNDSTFAMMGEKLFSDDPDLADAMADAGSIERVSRRRRSNKEQTGSKSSSSRKNRKRGESSVEPKPRDERKKRRSVSASGDSEQKTSTEQSPSEERRSADRRPRRRRRPGNEQGQNSVQSKQEGQRGSESSSRSKPRPGQHSSSISGKPAQAAKGDEQPSGNRRRRRRRGGNRDKESSNS